MRICSQVCVTPKSLLFPLIHIAVSLPGGLDRIWGPGKWADTPKLGKRLCSGIERYLKVLLLRLID